MLEKIKTFGLWFLIAIAIIGSVVLPIAYYYNVKYRDVTEYNHGIHAIDGGHFEIVDSVNYGNKNSSDVRVYLKCDECGEEICIPYFFVK
jgi:hypothetical protein|nr:MAG TPA: ubiquitin-binding zinc finger protein [Caudoviricetes sp.]